MTDKILHHSIFIGIVLSLGYNEINPKDKQHTATII